MLHRVWRAGGDYMISPNDPDTAHVLRDMPVKTSLPKIEVTKVSVDNKSRARISLQK